MRHSNLIQCPSCKGCLQENFKELRLTTMTQTQNKQPGRKEIKRKKISSLHTPNCRVWCIVSPIYWCRIWHTTPVLTLYTFSSYVNYMKIFCISCLNIDLSTFFKVQSVLVGEYKQLGIPWNPVYERCWVA